MKYEKVPDSIYEEYPDVYAYGEEYLIEDELFRKETEAELYGERIPVGFQNCRQAFLAG